MKKLIKELSQNLHTDDAIFLSIIAFIVGGGVALFVGIGFFEAATALGANQNGAKAIAIFAGLGFFAFIARNILRLILKTAKHQREVRTSK